MSLAPGTRLGPFEIVSPLGTGGMGEVYRARDTRLNRDVAIKVLPDLLALDPDRIERFRREAHLLASLNHSNIGGIHGLEDAGGRPALVLELVEGPTLAERITQGLLPLDESLAIARQIAEALEAAHEQGIVHRDLKPANIKLRPDGTVKVLDFGLAKALSRTDGAASRVARADLTASPTVMSPALMPFDYRSGHPEQGRGVTGAGMLLGTAAYMSPEQARGKEVDRRADIWAFGCVLYEMLTGRRAFPGDEVTDTLAGILRGEPEWHALPASTPASIRRLLRRCLEKNQRERLQAIGDARLEIVDAMSMRGDDATPVVSPQASPASRAMPAVMASLATAVVVAVATWMLKPDAPAVDSTVTRSLLGVDPFDLRPASEAASAVASPNRTALALSPDGRTLVFRGFAGGSTGWQLYARRLDSLDAMPISGTAGGANPFFSPDGAWIAYSSGGELRRVPAGGGPTASTAITRLPGSSPRILGASWGDGDAVVFATDEGLWRVSASGGTPERVNELGDAENARALPYLLPGAQAVLFTLQKTVFRWDDARIVVRTLATGEEKVLLEDAADARYVKSGHIVFVRRGKLMAVPFDPQRLELTGSPVAIVDDVAQAANMGNSDEDTGAGQFVVAANGTLVYVTGGVARDQERELVWVNRNGTSELVPLPRREYVAGRVSPDGGRLLAFTSASVNESGNRIWIYDIARGTQTALTTNEERVLWAEWSPDGARVAFANLIGGGPLMWKPADGSGKAEPIAAETAGGNPNSWSRDGKIAFVRAGDTTELDIWVADVATGERRAVPVVETQADERFPALSPDGKWLAFASNEGGRFDVYVQPYPGPGPRLRVSPSGGFAPTWRGDGAELFYYDANDGNISMRAVRVAATPSGFSVGTPVTLFEGRYAMSTPARGYDVTPDGQRFVMVRVVDRSPSPPTQMVLVENWIEELKRLAPVTR